MSTINTPALTLDHLQTLAPASFATQAHGSMSPNYRFIRTSEIISALIEAGFAPIHATQGRSRTREPGFAQHQLRFRVPVQEIDLDDCVPELSLLNSHDGSTSYQLRAGLERLVCRNGLLISMGSLPVIRIPHRKSLVGDLVAAALRVAEHFRHVGPVVRRMRSRELLLNEREELARQALMLRYGQAPAFVPVTVDAVLQPRRFADTDDTLWCVYNRLQEALLRGGVSGRTRSGRLTHTRGISAIGRSVALNEGLWSLASQWLH